MFPEGGIEYYLVAKSRLASGLAEAGQGGELPPHHLLVVAVHPKARPLETPVDIMNSSCK